MNKISALVLAVGMAALGAAAALIFFSSVTSLDESSGYSGPETSVGFDISDIMRLAVAMAQVPEPAPAPAPSDAPIERFSIPRLGIDADVSVKGVDASGVMETPNGPWDVSWYNFSARPGYGSNAVFSGHVDYYSVGAAVFYRLNELTPNDIVEVSLDDGTVYEYQVVSMENVNAAGADLGAIVGATDRDQVTLITCAGSFDAAAGEYDQRLIVRAERIL